MVTITFNFIIFFSIAFFNGYLFLNFFNKKYLKLNIFEISLIGIIITSLFAQFFNFFIPLNNFLIYFNILIILVAFILKKKVWFENSKINYPIILTIFLLTILNIYSSKFSDDLTHYHYSSILNTDNSNYIIGSSYLHHAYGFSSLWLIAHSYFNFDYSRLQDIHILNGLIFFLVLNIFCLEIFESFKKKNIKTYIPIIFLILIFILVKYSRIKEFGIDRPAFLLFYFVIYFYLKNFFVDKKYFANDDIYLLTIICISIIFIKITFAFIIILPLFFYLTDKKLSLILNKKIILIGAICISYLIKNFFISGCFIYPVEFLCIENVSWSNTATAIKESHVGELFNKSWTSYSGILSENEYVKNFNWFNTWLNRNLTELLELIVTLLITLLFAIISFNIYEKNKFKIKNNFYELKNKEKIRVLSTILLFCLLVFFIKNPVIRMSHHIFIIMGVIILMIFLEKKKIQLKNSLAFSVILIALFFNISKNLIRIYDSNFINDPVKLIYDSGLAPKNYRITEKKVGNFTYYIGWLGPSPTGNSELKNHNHKKILFTNIIYKEK